MSNVRSILTIIGTAGAAFFISSYFVSLWNYGTINDAMMAFVAVTVPLTAILTILLLFVQNKFQVLARACSIVGTAVAIPALVVVGFSLLISTSFTVAVTFGVALRALLHV